MRHTLFLLAIAASTLFAQEPKRNNVFVRTSDTMISGPFGPQIVKGQPYSAEVITESVQTLADGNRIVNSHASFVARDSQGRTRNEMNLRSSSAAKSNTGNTADMKIIMIFDPVAKVTYTLDTTSKTARKMPSEDGETMRAKLTAEAAARASAGARGNAGPAVPLGTVPIGPISIVSSAITAGPGGVFTATIDNASRPKIEELGNRVIEGVLADGIRTTETIPAGEMGNEKEIVITYEVWTAQDLKAIVLSKRNDPRVGEMTYRLSNIQRTEPAATLFEVPAGYTITEGVPKSAVTFISKD